MGLSYKLSKNHPHLTEFKDLINSFQLEFYAFYFELIYICCSELSASQDFPREHAYLLNWIFHASLPEESWLFPVIELSRIDHHFSVFGFCTSCQFSFKVPTGECIRGYDIDLTI